MGNYISYRSLETGTGKVKVMFPNGTVHEFEGPLTVAELMLEHPQQAVVEFGSLVSETRPTPLAADRKLETEKVYVMLPMKRGKVATLSDDEARQVLLSAKSVLRSGSLWSFTGILPLFAQICPAGREPVVLRRKDKVMEKEEKSNNTDLLSGVLDERPEYLTKQFSGKGWKPTLDTIKEKGVENKIPHWLFHTGKSSERIIL